jgi:hypothetical protein
MTTNYIPKVGDEIYVDTSLYLSHGADDFIGGKATVIEVKDGKSAGKVVPFVVVKEKPYAQLNWEFLREKQAKLAEEFGERRAHADPDLRPEFNRWD